MTLSSAQPVSRSRPAIAPEWFLVAVVLFWGLSFSLMKHWHMAAEEWSDGQVMLQAQASLALMAVRMSLAALCMACFRPVVSFTRDRAAWTAGTCVGLSMWVGLGLQLLGLAFTTPAMSSFFTSLASFFAPVLLLALGVRQSPWLWAGLGVALVGGVVMVEGGWRFGSGEGLTALAAVFFGLQVVVLDRMGGGLNSYRLSLAFMTVNAVASVLGVAGLIAWEGNGPGFLTWLAAMLSQPAVLFDMLMLLALPTLVGFGWMNRYQPLVGAGRAALIYLLEPVFATAFSLAYSHETLGWHLLLGGILVLGGNLVGELGRDKSPLAEQPPVNPG